MIINPSIKELVLTEEETETKEPCVLIVWNDEINTFQWVTQSLIDVCKHTPEQAEQSTWIIHFKGKYAVKHGTMEVLKPMKEGLTDRGIGATIEENS